MNGTELRGFSRIQLLTKIAYPGLSGNPEKCLILTFVFIH